MYEFKNTNVPEFVHKALEKKFLAETAKTKEETRRLKEETKYRQNLNVVSTLEADSVLASGWHTGVFYFNDPVTSDTVEDFIATLRGWSRNNPGKPLEVIFKCPGGSIIDGFALFDFIREISNNGHHVVTGCLGMAASMGGVLLQAGDERWIGQSSWLMIHSSAAGSVGHSWEMKDQVEFMERLEERIVDIYAHRTVKTRVEVKELLKTRRDEWLDAGECLEYGFVDRVLGKLTTHDGTSWRPKRKGATS